MNSDREAAKLKKEEKMEPLMQMTLLSINLEQLQNLLQASGVETEATVTAVLKTKFIEGESESVMVEFIYHEENGDMFTAKVYVTCEDNELCINF